MFSQPFLETQQPFLERLTQRALLHPSPAQTSLRHLRALQRFNTYGRLGLVTAPTLVVTGADDLMIPRQTLSSWRRVFPGPSVHAR